jgi:hypothetical protein
MFTAVEARKLTDQASGKYEKICEKIGLKVKELADAGKNEYAIYEEGFWGAMSIWEMRNPATEAQTLLMSLLRKYGYRVTLEPDGETYVPRGLADDDGDGPKHQNRCIVIRW